MTAIDATPGGASANSFTTVAFATDYLMTQRYPVPVGWKNANPGRTLRHYDDTEEVIEVVEQAAVLMMATRTLNNLEFPGSRTADTQALSWPRANVKDRYGVVIDGAVMPDELQQATAELANHYLENPPIEGPTANDMQLGPMRVTGFNKNSGLPASVSRLISHLTLKGANTMNRRIIRA